MSLSSDSFWESFIGYCHLGFGWGLVFPVTVVCAILAAFYSARWHRLNLPPGPTGVPLFGYLPFLGPKPFVEFMRLGTHYGSLLGMKLGTKTVVVLNDWAAIKDSIVRQSNLFAGRPYTFIFETSLKRTDIVTSDGPKWQQQRQLTLAHMGKVGMNKAAMQVPITEEVERAIDFLTEVSGCGKRPVLINDLFFVPVVNVIFGMAGSNRFQMDDPVAEELRKVIEYNSSQFSLTNWLNFLPWLRLLPRHPFWNFIKTAEYASLFMQKLVADHQATYQEGHIRDFIDIYLRDILKTPEAKRKGTHLELKQLVGTVYNFFTAGSETVQHTLNFGLLYMATWPEIQRKVQKEIKDVIGWSRKPRYADHKLLPYTSAVILEIQRYVSIVPLSIPHCPTEDAVVLNYTIPKGTFCFMNKYALDHSKDLWGDPEVFRPERFLNEDGKIYKPEYFIPFSSGARVCLGASLAKMELFLFLSSLLQKFTFSCITGEVPPSLKPVVAITLKPRPFRLMVTPNY